MSGLEPIGPPTGVMPVAPPITPPPSTSPETGARNVEPSQKGSLDADTHGFERNAANPVLRLIQTSAEEYAELVENGVAPPQAAAISGSPQAVESAAPKALDTYA